LQALTRTEAVEPEFVIGKNANSWTENNGCPSGYELITAKAECQTVFEEIKNGMPPTNMGFEGMGGCCDFGEENDNVFHVGCQSFAHTPGCVYIRYPYDRGYKRGKIGFQNPGCTDSNKEKNHGPVCKKVAPAPTSAPTPAPTTPMPPTPSPPTPCVGGTCTISEDPHVEVFDGAQISLTKSSHSHSLDEAIDTQKYGEKGGDNWLVKSDLVSIQARYMENDNLPERNLFVRAIAVGGAFLKGNTLVIGSLEDQVTWNGGSILEDQSSIFSLEGNGFFVKASRSANSSLVQDLSKTNPGVNVELPLGLSLVVNRLSRHVNVVIKMPQQEGGQDGICGNFNGVAADDAIEMSASRLNPQVPAEESLFQ